MNQLSQWKVEYDNDDKGSFSEWWTISNGTTTFRAFDEQDAYNLCNLLNETSTPCPQEAEQAAHNYAREKSINGVDYKIVKKDFLAGWNAKQSSLEEENKELKLVNDNYGNEIVRLVEENKRLRELIYDAWLACDSAHEERSGRAIPDSLWQQFKLENNL